MSAGVIPRAGLKLLGSLDRGVVRDLSGQNAAYDALIRQPVLQLVERINVELERFAPEYRADPRRAVSDPARSRRLDRHGLALRTDVVVRFPCGQRSLGEVAGFQLRISSTGVMVLGGTWRPSGPARARLHHWMATHEDVLQGALDASLLREVGPLIVDFADGRRRELRAERSWSAAMMHAVSMHLEVRHAPAVLVHHGLARTLSKTMRRMAPIVRLLDRGMSSDGAWSG